MLESHLPGNGTVLNALWQIISILYVLASTLYIFICMHIQLLSYWTNDINTIWLYSQFKSFIHDKDSEV